MERIGEYFLSQVIGEGGMGSVYLGEERLSRRRVAVKVLKKELAQLERVRRLFINEMEILARLEHPNIVRSLASVEHDGELAMVLELVDGCTLRALLEERGALPPPEAIAVIAAVTQALVAAHGHSPPVIHRDLKPDNIMIAQGGTVKVMDFGIAKLLERFDQTNTRNVGTLAYMSPEQIDADTIDHRSDLYALGLVFYELLVGQPPFDAPTPRELLNQQCTAPPPPLPAAVRRGLPADVEALLLGLLDKDPNHRPQSAREVLERLGDAVRTSTPPASVPSSLSSLAPATPKAAASWHASDARDAWLRRFGLERSTAAVARPIAMSTVPGRPALAGAGATADASIAPARPNDPVGWLGPERRARPPSREPHGELELTTRASVLIVAGLTLAAALATYALRTL